MNEAPGSDYFKVDRNQESDVALEPFPYAPPLDAGRVQVQTVERFGRRTMVTGLPGSVAAGVREVCGVNRQSGARACFPTRETAEGPSFSGILENSGAGETVALWPMPGGDGINSIDKVVQAFAQTRFPGMVSAMALSGDGLWAADRYLGLYHIPSPGSGDDPADIVPTRYTRADGLPDGYLTGYITAIAPAGAALWLGSSRGVLTRMTLSGGRPGFESLGASFGLPQAEISGLLPDRQGGLWIATYGGGLCLLKPDPHRVRCVTAGAEATSNLPTDFLTDIEEADGGLWIASGTGLARLTVGDGGVWSIRAYGEADGIAPNYISALARDTTGALWFAQNETGFLSLGRLTEAGGTLSVSRYRLSQAGFDYIERLAADPDGLWAATHRGTLVRVSPSPGGFAFATYSPADGLPAYKTIRSLIPRADGGLWIGGESTGVTLARFRGQSPDFLRLWDRAKLADNWVTALAAGDKGTHWIGTLSQGVSRFSLEGGRARFLSVPGLPPDRVWAIASDGRDGAWVVNGGLWHVVATASGFRVDRYTSGDGLPEGRLYDIVCSGASRCWLAGVGGLTLMTLESEVPSFRTFLEANGVALTRLLPNSLAAATDGTLWIAPDPALFWPRPLLIRLIPEEEAPRFSVFSDETGLPRGRIQDLAADLEGGVWLAFEGEIAHLSFSAGAPRVRVESNGFYALAADGNGGVYAGNSWTGISHYRIVDGDWVFSTVNRWLKGVPDAMIRVLSALPGGGVLAGSEGEGLLLYTP